MTELDDERCAALEQLHVFVEEAHLQPKQVRRERKRTEAPWHLTMSYVDWLFAYGHARIGNVDRATELADAAPRRLGNKTTDPVHAWVTSAFANQVRSVLEASEAPPVSVDGLDRANRYTVERLLEQSWLLGRGMTLDPIGRFSRPDAPPLERSPLRARIDALPTTFDVRSALVPIIEELARPIRDTLTAAAVTDALLDLIRFLGRSHPDELRDVWRVCEHMGEYTFAFQLNVAYLAGLLVLGDARADKLAAKLEAELPRDGVAQRIARTRALALAAQHVSTAERCAAIDRLARGIDRISDDSTKSYFCVSVLAFVECLVLGLVE